MTPESSQKVAPEASRGPKMRRKSAARFELQFRLVLGRFSSPKWCPKWVPKSLQNLTWASQAPPWTPKAARRPLGSHFGPIFLIFEGRLTRELRFHRFLAHSPANIAGFASRFEPPEKVRFSLLSFENNHIVSFKTFALATFGLGFRENTMKVPCETRGCAQNPVFYDTICVSATGRGHFLDF